MHFTQTFYDWVNQSLRSELPDSTKAFSFNLFEMANAQCKFGVELIASDQFDPSDEDWACHEVWEPKSRKLLIPNSFADSNWQDCLERMTKLVSNYIESNTTGAAILRRFDAVAIGFVDGNLNIVFER